MLLGEKIPACGPLMNGEIIWDSQWGSTAGHYEYRSLLLGSGNAVADWNLNYFLGKVAQRDGSTVYVN